MTSLTPPLQAVVALFRGPLHNVRFADIDASGLSTLAEEVEGAAAEVQAHETKLAELRQLLSQKQETLLGLAQQALAYARIYAEGDEALSAELNDIALPRAAKPRKAAPAKASASRDEQPPSSVVGGGADQRSSLANAQGERAVASASGAEAEASAVEASEAEASEVEAVEAAAEGAAPKTGRRKVPRRLGRPASRGESA
jgi:hypothetical protein